MCFQATKESYILEKKKKKQEVNQSYVEIYSVGK